MHSRKLSIMARTAVETLTSDCKSTSTASAHFYRFPDSSPRTGAGGELTERGFEAAEADAVVRYSTLHMARGSKPIDAASSAQPRTMAEFQGNRISKSKDPGCWRLCHVQTSGCMATERRTTDEQREQQQIVLDYVTDGGCDVAGLGDTRLGDDATEVCRMARGIEARARDEALMKALEGLDAN